MLANLTDLATQNLVEVVDHNNNLLAVLSKDLVTTHKLTYRALTILCKDQQSKSLLKIYNTCLDVQLFDLPAGASVTEFTEQFLQTTLKAKPKHLLNIELLPPTNARPCFVYVIGAVLAGKELANKVAEDCSYLLVDDQELTGLNKQGFTNGNLLAELLARGLWQNFHHLSA